MWTNPYVLSKAVEQYQQDLIDNARRWHLVRGARRERRADRGHGTGGATRHAAEGPAGASPAGAGRPDRGAAYGARTAPRSSTPVASVGVGTLAVCGRREAEPVR
jgi:hypothetical protein